MDLLNETENFSDTTTILTLHNETFVFNISLLGPQRDSLYIVIPITVIYAIIFFTGVVGNVSTCIVIARNKSMHTATNYYLFSLAISDLLLLVTGLPQEMHSIWSRYPYVFGEVFCVLRGLASETSANATVLTITAFTVERYVAICHPFLSHTMSKLSRAVKLILAVWLVAFSFAVPQALQFGLVYSGTVTCQVKKIIIQHSFELSTFLFFVAPMTLITVLYALIGLRLRTSDMMKRNSGSVRNNANNSKRSCRHQHGQSSRRVLKMLVAVVVAFFICWAPFHAQRLVAIYSKSLQSAPSYKLKLYEIITYISGVLYYVSTTVNPVLYHIMSNKFREAFKETFSRCWCWECGERRGRSGSGRLSERRSCYSVLSRSGRARPGAHQDSTDSGTSVTQRHSEDSTTLHPAAVRGAAQGILCWCWECGERRGRSGSGRLSERRSCYSVLSRSGRARPGAHQDSTDSGTSVTQRHSEDSTTLHPAAVRGAAQGILSHDTDTTESKSKCVPEQFTFDMHQVVSLNKLSIQYDTKRRSRATRFLNMFRCIAKRSLDDKKLQPYTPSPISEHCEREKAANEVNERFHIGSYDVSNSSLRDIESGALEDELTIYMKEIQRREKDKS